MSFFAGHTAHNFFNLGHEESKTIARSGPAAAFGQVVSVELANAAQIPRLNQLLSQHHYLGKLRPVGQRLYYIARNAGGQWVALLVFSAKEPPST